MNLVGFNFTKIVAERTEKPIKDVVEKLKINTNIDIESVEKLDPGVIKSKNEVVSIKFKYIINYVPDFAKIEFNGHAIISLEQKQAKSLLKEWKNKKISKEIQPFLYNIILRKSNIRALQFEDELNLPLHIPLPRMTSQSQDSEK